MIKTIRMMVFCLVFLGVAPGQHEPAKNPHHSNAKWSTPTVGIEGITSHSYSRFSGHTQLGHLRLTGAMVNSEGNPFGQFTTGWAFTPIKSEHTEFFIEPEVGTAITADKTRPVVGLRMLYQSQNWFVESWCTYYPGRNNWTNCEPLADAMHHVAKGFYAGWVSSSFIGVPKNSDEHGKAKSNHPERVRHFFGGLGAIYRRGHLDVGASYELGLNKGAKNYVALFGSYTF